SRLSSELPLSSIGHASPLMSRLSYILKTSVSFPRRNTSPDLAATNSNPLGVTVRIVLYPSLFVSIRRRLFPSLNSPIRFDLNFPLRLYTVFLQILFTILPPCNRDIDE